MKAASKQELHQIAINHLPGIEITDFINIYEKWTAKLYSFLVNDAALASDNLLCFRHNLLERTWKLIMTINDTIRDEKLQHVINREAAKISALSSHNIILQVKKYNLLIKVEW